ncbi:MAG: 6-bladed beta-propeller [Bacteroidota bacterium]
MQRRSFLRNTAQVVPGLTFHFPRPRAEDELIVGHGDHRYRVRADWAKVSPRQYPLLNCHEMVADKSGKLYMLGDHSANNVLVFDRSGKVLDAWGYRYPAGHGLTISDEGDEEFLFICDTGSHSDRRGRWRNQPGSVTKTRLNGEVIFQLGHPQTDGIYEPGMPYHPTETAVAPNGDIYVADGYGSGYVIRYDARGRYVEHFGGKDNADPRYNLHQPHGVAIDTRGDTPHLVVNSRNDQAFKFFTLDGKYLDEVVLPGAYVCRPVIHGQYLLAGVCFADTSDGRSRQQHYGYVTILDAKNKVISNPGGTEPGYVGGALQPMYQDERVHGLFHHGHDVCVDADENLYLCQWNAKGAPPILLERV